MQLKVTFVSVKITSPLAMKFKGVEVRGSAGYLPFTRWNNQVKITYVSSRTALPLPQLFHNSPRSIYWVLTGSKALWSLFYTFGLIFFVCSSLFWELRHNRFVKFAVLSLKLRSHVSILVYRTWAICTPRKACFRYNAKSSIRRMKIESKRGYWRIIAHDKENSVSLICI